MVGAHDFVILVRRWRQHGSRRLAGAWAPAATTPDALVATAIADLVMSANPEDEARALKRSELMKELGAEEQERILDLLHNPRTNDTARAAELRQAAAMELAGPALDRRAGNDRRSGRQRRSREGGSRLREVSPRPEADRRSGRERRS